MLQMVSNHWAWIFRIYSRIQFMAVFTKGISRGVGSETDQSAAPAEMNFWEFPKIWDPNKVP